MRITPLFAIFAPFALLAACAPENTISIRFRSEAIRRSVSTVNVFVFAPTIGDGIVAASEAPSCEELDPRGLGPGDAEERTGRRATYTSDGTLRDTIAEFSDLPKGHYTLVIEAWGPSCDKIAEQSPNEQEPSCERLAASGPLVMRGYTCTGLELESGTRTDRAIELQTFAAIGAKIAVPTNFPANAIHYSETNPLPIVDGLEGGDRFTVQLLNGSSEPDDDVKVRWSVSRGSGSFDAPQPSVTALDVDIQDSGLSSVVLRAGATASGIDGGRITAIAYAPGYEGGPVEIEARALRGVEIDLQSMMLPIAKIDLEGPDSEFRLVTVDDLDGDGRADIAVVGGREGSCSGAEAFYQLAVLYGREGAVFQPAYSTIYSGEALAIASARIDRSGRRALMISTASWCSRFLPTPHGSTYVMQAPAIAAWSGFDDVPPPGDDVLRASRVLITESVRCSGAMCEPAPQPIDKGAISIDAKDIDGDGVDEIAMSRCSYIYAPSSGQISRVDCHGELADRTDSELTLLTADIAGGALVGFHQRASIGDNGNDGGFREVRFADVSGDGSLDLVAATQTEVTVVCGRRNMPDTGFGFAANPQRSDANITFAQGFSVGPGFFNGDQFADLLVGGGLRAASPDSGIKLNPGQACSVGDGAEPIIAGPRTRARMLIVRVADLNNDGRDDALVLHRETRLLETYFGSGTDRLARGPTISLGSSINGELGVFVENPGEDQVTVAATTGPGENAVHAIRFRPSPKSD